MSSWLRQCFSSVNINHLELQSSCNRTTQLWLWLLWLAAHESNMNLNNESFQSESDAGFSNPNEASCEKQWQLEKHTYLLQNVHYFKENNCFLSEWQGTSCASCVQFFPDVPLMICMTFTPHLGKNTCVLFAISHDSLISLVMRVQSQLGIIAVQSAWNEYKQNQTV